MKIMMPHRVTTYIAGNCLTYTSKNSWILLNKYKSIDIGPTVIRMANNWVNALHIKFDHFLQQQLLPNSRAPGGIRNCIMMICKPINPASSANVDKRL
jgi:hypothetical protein